MGPGALAAVALLLSLPSRCSQDVHSRSLCRLREPGDRESVWAFASFRIFKSLAKFHVELVDIGQESVECPCARRSVSSPGAKPPVLHTIRRSEDEVVLIYSSPPQLCAFAIGIARGVAKQFNKTIEVTQTKCMHSGAPHCEIIFRKGWRFR
jgi:hypothetical protein